MRGDYLRDVLDSGICPRCEKRSNTIDEQYSYGVYAGVMCKECAMSSYRDQCGHRAEGQGDPNELDEQYEPDDPSDIGYEPDYVE